MEALVALGNKAVLRIDRPLPKLRDDYVLIKTAAIALNPTDWKHLDNNLVGDGALIGCDFAGTVVDVGQAVARNWCKGDPVAGVAKGGNAAQPEDGAFAEYVVAKGDMLIQIPKSLSFEKAVTLPLGVATVMQGLYQKGLRINLPDDPVKEKTFVLIYGGSTAAGAIGIQFAKLSGYTVLATCSLINMEYVKSLGADEVFDYRDDEIGPKIRKITQNKLKLAWDLISKQESAKVCAEALSADSSGCRYASFLSNKSPRKDVESVGTNMYTIYGESFTVGSLHYPACLQDFEWAKKFFTLTEKLLSEDKLRPHRERVEKGGLEGALQGLDDLRNHKVSGQKLVYRIGDSP